MGPVGDPCLGCLNSRSGDLTRDVRNLILCILKNLDVEPVVVDNGPRYSAIFYVELNDQSAVEGILRRLEECFKAIPRSNPLSEYLGGRSVRRIGGGYVVIFNKEYIDLRVAW